MPDQLPPAVERLVAINSTMLLLAGMVTLANHNPLGYVEVHKSDIRRIAEALQSYLLTVQAEMVAAERQQVAVQDPQIAEAA